MCVALRRAPRSLAAQESQPQRGQQIQSRRLSRAESLAKSERSAAQDKERPDKFYQEAHSQQSAAARPYARLMQGVQFSPIRRFCNDRYVIEWSVCLRAAGVRRNCITAVNHLVCLNEYRIGSRVAAVLKANTAQPAPALLRMHGSWVRYFEAIVGADLFERSFEVIADDFMECGCIWLSGRRLRLRQRDAAATRQSERQK
jgi:hypothetical protein